jgi:GxxExxY protein
MNENDISYKIRHAIFEVYNNLGPGLLESIYETVLKYELELMELSVENQVPMPVYYKGIELDMGFRLDLLVDKKVIIEIKSLENLLDVHHKQLLTYLKVTGLKLGLLVNFNTSKIVDSIIRIVNNL